MACELCGRPECDGGCEGYLLPDLEELSTAVFRVSDKGIEAEDFRRLEGGDFDVDVEDVAHEVAAGSYPEIELDIDDLVDDEPVKHVPDDPFDGPLVLLDGTSDEVVGRHQGDASPFGGGIAAAEQEPQDAGQGPACSPNVAFHGRSVAIVVSLGRIFLKRWGLSKRPISIGRDADCDITLNSPQVSRRHCEIRNAGGGVDVLCDGGSANGTTVNNEPVRSAELRPGTIIGVGKFFLFYDPSPEQLAHLERPPAKR